MSGHGGRARGTCVLLGQDNQADELLGADVPEAAVSHLLRQAHHEVENRLAAQHFVADVRAQHDGRLILQNVGGKAGPDSQPEELIFFFWGGGGYNSMPHKHKSHLCSSGQPRLFAICPILCQTYFIHLLSVYLYIYFFKP